VAGSCEYGDEPSGSDATELVSLFVCNRRVPCTREPLQVRTRHGKIELGRLRPRWENIVKMYANATEYEDMNSAQFSIVKNSASLV
jgi:hypothetical protein